MSRQGTAYVAVKSACGCAVTFQVNNPEHRKDVAKQVADDIRHGLDVYLLPLEEAKQRQTATFGTCKHSGVEPKQRVVLITAGRLWIKRDSHGCAVGADTDLEGIASVVSDSGVTHTQEEAPVEIGYCKWEHECPTCGKLYGEPGDDLCDFEHGKEDENENSE